jgi:hypothetical protein
MKKLIALFIFIVSHSYSTQYTIYINKENKKKNDLINESGAFNDGVLAQLGNLPVTDYKTTTDTTDDKLKGWAETACIDLQKNNSEKLECFVIDETSLKGFVRFEKKTFTFEPLS